MPGLTDTIEITKARLPGFLAMPSMDKYHELIKETELAFDGVVVNSFDDLEPVYYE